MFQDILFYHTNNHDSQIHFRQAKVKVYAPTHPQSHLRLELYDRLQQYHHHNQFQL